MTLGQITPETEFGKALTQMAESANTIVEIGTWHGLGSTKCLQNGMLRPEQRMWTIEQDVEIFSGAKARFNDDRIQFLNGYIVNGTNAVGGKNVIPELPEQIDLLLIDGGDREAKSEFDLLIDRTRIVAMDDTREVKNEENRRKVIAMGWDILWDNLTERYGWMIARRPS